MNHGKVLVIAVLITALLMGVLSGCSSGPKDVPLQPLDLEWGLTQEEAAAKIKCVYSTNEKASEYLFVENGDNDNTLQAYGAAPVCIFYEFNLVKQDSNDPRLGRVTFKYAKDSYDTVLAALTKACGECYFEDPQWGTTDSNIYLFEDGLVLVEYSGSPIVNPKDVAEESRDRYVALSGLTFANQKRIASLAIERFAMLNMYSTAETDFVLVDNSK